MTYSTIQGETWDIVSKKVYGTEFRADVLLKANPDVADIIVFSSGILLLVPEIDDVEQFDSLPPWKRVSG